MKKLQPFLLFMMLLLSGFSGVSAQQEQKTVYQKKIVEITQKYFKVLYGYKKQLTVYEKMQLDLMTNGEEARSFLLGLGMLSYSANHSEIEVKRLINQFKSELKQAEQLKTSVDFKREKKAKDKKEREERERKLKEQQEAYERTDAGSIKKSIKESFEEWNRKGEFEKEADYFLRLKNKSQDAFLQICLEQIKSKVGYYYCNDIEKELSIYDSEKELFTVTFKRKEVKWQNILKIPIANAANFKKKWSNLECKIDDYDWCFIENNLCPKLITLVDKVDNSIYKFPLLLNNQSEISYSFDEFRITNLYLKNNVFSYSSAKSKAEQIEKEKLRMDSLAIKAFNQKLDSIFNDYNHQLLLNPYNISQEQMTYYPKVSWNNDSRINFEDCVSSIKYNFDRLNDSFLENKKVYETVDQMPQFPGGEEELKVYINSRMKYPIYAYENGIEGKIILRFVVTKTGQVDKVEVVRPLDYECDKEAIRVIKSLPTFIPAKQNNVNVAVWYTLPVYFKLKQ
ncbi:MAG: energy transducer TonB [Paludibacter sp.]